MKEKAEREQKLLWKTAVGATLIMSAQSGIFTFLPFSFSMWYYSQTEINLSLSQALRLKNYVTTLFLYIITWLSVRKGDMCKTVHDGLFPLLKAINYGAD